MVEFLKGKGSQKQPFNSKVRDILRVLIKDPRIKISDVIKELKGKTPNITDLRQAHFDGGEFADAVKFRVFLEPRRYRSGAGTCFVYVKLQPSKNKKKSWDKFEKDILTVSGVIEWDQISGHDADYLVRIAGKVGDDLAKEVAERLGELPNVRSCYMNQDISIWKSGVVDNFEPDHFLEIDPEA